MSKTFAQTPLTVKQVAILAYLRRTKRKTPPDCEAIGRATGYRNISSTLRSLQFRGLIEIGKAGPRMVVLRLTDEGNARITPAMLRYIPRTTTRPTR